MPATYDHESADALYVDWSGYLGYRLQKAAPVLKVRVRQRARMDFYEVQREAVLATVDRMLADYWPQVPARTFFVPGLRPAPAPSESWDVFRLHVVDTSAADDKAPDAVDVAAAAFARALREQPGVYALDAESAEALGARAAELAGSGVEWLEHVGEVIDVHAAQDVLRVGSRQAVYDLVKRNRLLGLRRSGGAMAIPTFQIDPATGRPYRAVPPILAAFAEGEVDAYSVASWFNNPQVELGGRTPAAVLRDPGGDHSALTQCARAAAARWSQ